MEPLYTQLEGAIRAGDVEAGRAEAARLAESGASPLEIFRECIEPCLKTIGDQFSRLEIFLPEMMMAGEAMSAVVGLLAPQLKGQKRGEPKARIAERVAQMLAAGSTGDPCNQTHAGL